MTIRKTKALMKSPKFHIGDYTYGTISFAGRKGYELLNELVIGKFCSIASGVEMIIEGYHHNPEWFTTYPLSSDYVKEEWPNTFKKTVPKKPEHRFIRIGNDVWIGKDVKLFSNITIGDGAIIGTGAQVTKDVPPYSIAVGCPLTIIRKRFKEDIIDYLLKLKWWDWPKAKIDKYGPILCSSSLEQLKAIGDV